MAIVAEFKRTLGTWWVQEMTNFNLKTLGVTFFCYLACVAPAITFGAVYDGLVGHWLGPTETLVGTAWFGIAYALFAGMPIMINGGTGPVLAFTTVLYNVSMDMDVPFLTFRAWIGVWIFFYMVMAAVFDLNRYVHLATRFTDEIFSMLISVIFIVNALYNFASEVGIFHYFNPCHKSHIDKVPISVRAHCEDLGSGAELEHYSYIAAGLLSVLCCVGTTVLAMKLKAIKASPYFFHPKVREIIADFAVVASALTFILIDRLEFADVSSETLNAPNEVMPSFQCCDLQCRRFYPDDCLPGEVESFGARPWLVDFWDLNGKTWVPFFSAAPALLGFLLLFLDNGITWHLIMRPDNQLKHGHAYNYDTLIVGIGVLVNSIFGLPWLCAATVRSVNHLLALAEKDVSGRSIVSVQETRLTHLLIHGLITATIFSLSLLKSIPMSVLYGIFLYMGVTALGGNQFYERLHMLFMQPDSGLYPKRHYNEPYVARMAITRYTAYQLALFLALYVVKSIKAIAIAFPVIIALCVPMRSYFMPTQFTAEEMILLDGDDDEIAAIVAKTDKDQKAGEVELGKASPTANLIGKREDDGASQESEEGASAPDAVGALEAKGEDLAGVRRRSASASEGDHASSL